ncbi:Lrp/AsnC family transcriptional regulator [Paracoccus methylarcula]|uniref:Lrp/AsnC family transcriptional regulator n=1 Tax=Paracoccus methylarcula TaxID=72022 RepID=A0A3R7LPT0_9RHOB|nr:Lrp/AsnC family transcriptional regulator [Paracoccus methylarcula]RNF34621.1 Lrp/AsnC family transcriptional regulator [Paracoccus methylarcula]
MSDLDQIDHDILKALQQDASLSQRELAERIGLSQNACWRRLQKLTEAGILRGSRASIDAAQAGLHLTVFVMIRTRHHDDAWAHRFRARVESIPEITEFHRIGGEWDYMAKLVTTSMSGYDRCYKALIEDMNLERVTGVFSMETIFEGRPLRLP